MKFKIVASTFISALAIFSISAQAYPADVRLDTNSQSNVYVTVTPTESAPWYCAGSQNAINVDNQPVLVGFSTDCPYTVTYSNDGSNYLTCDSAYQPINPTFTVTVTRNNDNSLSCSLQKDSTKK